MALGSTQSLINGVETAWLTAFSLSSVDFPEIQGVSNSCSRKRLYSDFVSFNRLKPNDAYIGRTAPLISRRCILYIYSTNIRTEYFKHVAHSPIFFVQNAVYFIILSCLVPVLFAFYIQGVLKFKCKIPEPKS